MDGVRYVPGDADSRGPTGVYSWMTSQGARITLSLPRDKPLTEKLRQFVEDHAHRALEESDEPIDGFNYSVGFPDPDRG